MEAVCACALLVAGLVGVVDAASERVEYHFYRAAGPVSFDGNGVPEMKLVVGSGGGNASGLVHMATAVYNNSLFDMGWDQLSIAADQEVLKSGPDSALTGWYAAGYAEGYSTMVTIGQVLVAQAYNYSTSGQLWVDKHLAYVKENSLKNTNDEFWVQVRKQLLQMYGMAAGYNERAAQDGSSSRISFEDIFQANLYNEYSDIAPAAQALYGGESRGQGASLRVREKVPRTPDVPTVPYSEQHCSGLVKVTKDDIFMSHVTWCSFFVFVGRQYKTYYMETTVSMSSNAALINSGGDWYQTSNKLAVIETTNEFTSTNLYPLIVPECVAEFMRVMVANFLATNGKEWTATFAKEPSGTYCNQWMVLDYKLYTKGMTPAQLPDNLFWILEAIPGTIQSGDLTWFIREHGYWGSYNIPYFPNIYALSGFQQQYDAYGTAFSWSECPRAQIFRRDHHKVTDLLSMQRMMRYNDWQHDPLSAIPNCTGCSPASSPLLGISSRLDLVPANASFGNLGANYAGEFQFAYFGGTDAKISSYDMISDGFTGSFINGPTHDTQPVFSWSVDPTNPLAQLPGMIQTFDFDWQTVVPEFKVNV